MIRINVVRDKDGFIWEFSVKGHASYAEHGKDIVCAAVSAIAYTGAGALEELAGISNYIEKNGYMKCSVPLDIESERKPIVKTILETTIIGFKQIELQYRKFVSVLDEEV